MPSSFESRLEVWCFSGATSRVEKLFVELKFVMCDNKRLKEKLQEEKRLQIHTALLPFGSPWGNEMFKQATWYQESHALQQIIRSFTRKSLVAQGTHMSN